MCLQSLSTKHQQSLPLSGSLGLGQGLKGLGARESRHLQTPIGAHSPHILLRPRFIELSTPLSNCYPMLLPPTAAHCLAPTFLSSVHCYVIF